MKYFSVHNSDLESEEFISSTPTQIATWLLLHAYCTKQLNGGKIANAKSLPAGVWMRQGIMPEAITEDSPLWFWEGENLSLSFYDQHGQEVYEKKVAGGKERARRRYSSTPTSILSSTPTKRADADKNRVDKKKGDVPKATSQKDSSQKTICTIEQAISNAPMCRMTAEQAEHWWHTRNASDWTKGSSGGGAPRRITSWQSDMATSASWVAESLSKSNGKKGGTPNGFGV